MFSKYWNWIRCVNMGLQKGVEESHDSNKVNVNYF